MIQEGMYLPLWHLKQVHPEEGIKASLCFISLFSLPLLRAVTQKTYMMTLKYMYFFGSGEKHSPGTKSPNIPQVSGLLMPGTSLVAEFPWTKNIGGLPKIHQLTCSH